MPPNVLGLVDLGRALGLEVVAEGVESEAQRARLLDGRCVSGQGFLFAAPLGATDAELLLLGQRPAPCCQAAARLIRRQPIRCLRGARVSAPPGRGRPPSLWVVGVGLFGRDLWSTGARGTAAAVTWR